MEDSSASTPDTPGTPTEPSERAEASRPAAPEKIPGRTSGFVCGLIAVLFAAVPVLVLPLGIIGIVKSSQALRRMPAGTEGRGLPLAGLIMSIAALALFALALVLQFGA